jgi:hypothetical protein
VNITRSGNYSVEVKGTMVYYTVFEEIENQGQISEITNFDIKSFFDNMVKEEPAIKTYEYQNNGRAYIEYFREINDGSSLDLSPINLPLAVSVNRDSSITVRVSAISNRKKIEKFKKYGYQSDGTVKIISALPIIDDGGQKAEARYFLFGPKVARYEVTFDLLPAEDIVIIIGTAE